ncbi:MMPL family transporter [Haloglycomyces albus]|uniref:MMPL family transporter n=1 Tax=Haloglycomyces albus TaxID=526067 RepID=UPI00046D937A|nr:MMPL family transporter [Haloglycomyces albus]
MATFLYRLGRGAYRKFWLVIGLWLAVAVGVGIASAQLSEETDPSFSIPGTESQEAFDLIDERFPEFNADGATANVVFVAPDGEKITAEQNVVAVQESLAHMDGVDQVAAVQDPFENELIAPDQSLAVAKISFDEPTFNLTDGATDSLESVVDAGEESDLRVEVGGDALMSEPDVGSSEIIGIAVAAVVLIITFGTFVAAGLPLLTAVLGVGLSTAAIAAATAFADVNESTGTLATMLGLAVGIDYALFILFRYRSELNADTVTSHDGRADAIGRANGTAGGAVVFAGLIVAIALLGLSVVRIPFLTTMAIAAAATIVLAVVIAITLLPALARLLGKRILPGKQRRQAVDAEKPNPAGGRWAGFVSRHPVLLGVAALIGLGTIAYPMTDLELALPDDGMANEDTMQRQAYDLIADAFGPGFNGPLMVVGDMDGQEDPQAAYAELKSELEPLDGVAVVGDPIVNQPDNDMMIVSVSPTTGPADHETTELVDDIRSILGDGTTVDWSVTGQTAINIDVSQRILDSLLPYLAIVVGLAFVLLVLVFRSILVPLAATFGFLLSVFAAFGALVAVFQWGWASSIFGVDQPGPIMSVMPIIMVGIVFGLAMDYQIFLVTRIREAYVHGEDPVQAIITGFALTARVVVAAALIMISVFAAFLLSDESMIPPIGFGLAAAVLFDAFVVRMALMPAFLAVTKKAAWWLPGWLDRVLPNFDVEGERLVERLDHASEDAHERQTTATAAS